ncbi:hypothetical protein [Bradyrhizobium sp. dw_411]|uniref:hypothetical protein n=1 Tax=Bradyrhizobium sp. dw_411 TaxID=2720082 RepID=UPI001BCACAC5|nr:hypothetical protein [Bradyrhizobium sp. dw_411]
MKHASFHIAETVSSETVLRAQKTIRRNFFAGIFAALHLSRRAQAQRVLRQYRDLVADPKDTDLHNLNKTIGANKNAGE